MAKKFVKTTESQLHNLISEAVEEYLSDKTYASSDDIFNLNEIPMEILDKGWVRYHPYLFNINHRNPLTNRVIEE